MTRILAIDPGSERSGWLILDSTDPGDTGRVLQFGLDDNVDVVVMLRSLELASTGTTWDVDVVVIEWIESYGKKVGREVFETVHWSGRFTEAAGQAGIHVEQIPRRRVKAAICHDTTANDSTVIAAIVERWGGKARAVGTTKERGPLYGIRADVWQALALAIAFAEGAR